MCTKYIVDLFIINKYSIFVTQSLEITTKWYKKPITADTLLNYESKHQLHYK